MTTEMRGEGGEKGVPIKKQFTRLRAAAGLLLEGGDSHNYGIKRASALSDDAEREKSEIDKKGEFRNVFGCSSF
jgi:hypothetical protein